MASSANGLRPPNCFIPRRKSSGVLDSAETLVDNLDSLADILDQIADKYETIEENVDQANHNKPASLCESSREASLFRKLKTGLDSARSLINCLRLEKGRLIKREFSVEMRLNEMEDYKGHIKQDLTSLNDLVDGLTVRVCELEQNLCEEQERREEVEAEKTDLEDRMRLAEEICTGLAEEKDQQDEEIKKLKLQRTDTCLKLENNDLKQQIEVLLEENMTLKEMLRKERDTEITTEGDLGTSHPGPIEDTNNNSTELITTTK